jgi:hypothetical protein
MLVLLTSVAAYGAVLVTVAFLSRPNILLPLPVLAGQHSKGVARALLIWPPIYRRMGADSN